MFEDSPLPYLRLNRKSFMSLLTQVHNTHLLQRINEEISIIPIVLRGIYQKTNKIKDVVIILRLSGISMCIKFKHN